MIKYRVKKNYFSAEALEMLIDLTHNKIISDTITEGFVSNVNAVLVPLVEGIFGDSAISVQMYEDYLADGFKLDGRWCYPLTVLTDEGARTLWISWSVSKRHYKDGIPYSYVGKEPIDFAVMDSVPDEFLDKLAGRNTYFGAGTLKIKIHTASDDPLFLSGKFSQTFIDEMAKQLTELVSNSMSVSGLDDSCLSLQMIFTPETYMEHTSENVTYRRLRLADKTSAPRDFWIKWTRTNSAVAYSVSDVPALGTIVFELGEDVSQKIREKEYRFLLTQGADKYHSAMSRKNITEWRELVKRAVKRGELTKTDAEKIANTSSCEPEDELSALLASVAAGTVGLETAEPEEKDTTLEDALKSILEDPITEPEEEELEEPVQEIAPEAPVQIEEKTIDLFEAAGYAPRRVHAELPDDEEITEIKEDIETAKDALKIEENKENTVIVPENSADKEAILRAEIEAKIRLEYESVARMKAEEEARRLAEEQEKLRRENERLLEEARLAEEKRQREETERREREEKLRAEIEAKVRAEAREKERLAEAAMLAIEEKRRLEAEKAERERRAAEEARLKEADRRAAEERARLEAERRREAERIRKEAEERIEREREEMRKALGAQIPEPQETKPKYTFTAKRVLFFFRGHVDPNITVPMEAIIRSTLEKANKTDVPINIKASVVDDVTVCLDFAKIPKEEEELFIKIVQALGNGNLGIAKARVEQL